MVAATFVLGGAGAIHLAGVMELEVALHAAGA